MQNEAVADSVRILREQERSESGGLPLGEARGRIILPCGTGKTRISLRIIEELTPPGELSVVLCPSIALVAQIRREYLQHATVPLDVLAVCSDATAGYAPSKEGTHNTAKDPTADNSNFSASEVKGRVTTDAGEIVDWMRQGRPRQGNQGPHRHLPEQRQGIRSPTERRWQGARPDCRRSAQNRRFKAKKVGVCQGNLRRKASSRLYGLPRQS